MVGEPGKKGGLMAALPFNNWSKVWWAGGAWVDYLLPALARGCGAAFTGRPSLGS